ncbi:MAG: prepilin-type N-terminal cleavage/methylation domain-containing protein [Opitutae bacterium]|nr:prepilin-type N-terminal cleavage/methylation domain-containing protein [Opitutae bacterium]
MRQRSEPGRVTGGASRIRRGRAGYTLLEILVTLALIGLLTSLIVGGTTALLRERPATAEEVMRAAIAKARRYAVENYRVVRLAYDNKGKAFVASTVDGERTFPVDLPEELQLEFLAAQKGGAILLGGEAVETAKVPYVSFYVDGTCSPFRVQMRSNNGPARIVAIDPWTCAPMLEVPK